jgi:hypothetical protein
MRNPPTSVPAAQALAAQGAALEAVAEQRAEPDVFLPS